MVATTLVFDPRAEHGEAAFDAVLDDVRAQAQARQLPYAGIVSAQDAWQLVQAGKARLVDVRTNEERVFVGHVPGSLHVAWATGTAMNRNPRFARDAEAAAQAGFSNVFNIAQGFEGDLDDQQQRGHQGGWHWHCLPWVQE